MSDRYKMLYGVYRDVYTWISFVGFIIERSDGTFKGKIVDAYGNAEIKGSIDGNHLQFSKIYDEACNTSITYTTRNSISHKLKLISDEKWIGSFTLASGRTNTVECILKEYMPTPQDRQDATFIKLMMSLNE